MLILHSFDSGIDVGTIGGTVRLGVKVILALGRCHLHPFFLPMSLRVIFRGFGRRSLSVGMLVVLVVAGMFGVVTCVRTLVVRYRVEQVVRVLNVIVVFDVVVVSRSHFAVRGRGAVEDVFLVFRRRRSSVIFFARQDAVLVFVRRPSTGLKVR